jgi:hypothetical protein
VSATSLCGVHSSRPIDYGEVDRWAPHNFRRHILQSVFRSAARRRASSLVGTAERRDGELKTCWTKPPHESSVYGFSMATYVRGLRWRGSAGLSWVQVNSEASSFLVRIDKIGLGTTGVGSIIVRHGHTSTTHWASPVGHQSLHGQQRRS